MDAINYMLVTFEGCKATSSASRGKKNPNCIILIWMRDSTDRHCCGLTIFQVRMELIHFKTLVQECSGCLVSACVKFLQTSFNNFLLKFFYSRSLDLCKTMWWIEPLSTCHYEVHFIVKFKSLIIAIFWQLLTTINSGTLDTTCGSKSLTVYL